MNIPDDAWRRDYPDAVADEAIILREDHLPREPGAGSARHPIWFDSSPDVIQLVVMLYLRYPLSLRNVEDLAFERGIDMCHETVRKWVNRFGPMFAAKIRAKRVHAMRQHTHWRWHLDEVYVRVQGEMRYLWRAVDHEGEVLESFVTKTRDKVAALKFMKKLMQRHGCAEAILLCWRRPGFALSLSKFCAWTALANSLGGDTASYGWRLLEMCARISPRSQNQALLSSRQGSDHSCGGSRRPYCVA